MASKGSLEEDFVFKPPPPPNLSKESIVIWIGWHCKGDKEVSREAAAKGIDIKLVVLFLSLRKKLSSEEAESLFKKEVLLWVSELLDRKQIFRVSHVLKNINLDPDKELLKVFLSTTKKDLREYIGNHLRKLNELSEDIQQLWCFLNMILDNNLLVSKYRLLEDSIDCLNKQSTEWKQEIAAKLFLRTYDTTLLPYLNGETIWKQLLAYNDIKLLKIWIDIQFNETTVNYSIHESILKVFQSFPITNDMINDVTVTEVSTNTCQVVLNQLSKFGIFSYNDINDFTNILRRIDVSDSVANIFDILSRKHSNMPVDKFLKLLIEYCLEHNLHHVLNVCIKNFDLKHLGITVQSFHTDLILNFRQLTTSFDEAQLCDNIFKVSRFLCDDLVNFFKQNPMILLTLLFFTENVDILSVLNQKSLIISDIQLFPAVSELLENFKVLRALYNKTVSPTHCTLTYYDLLEKHMKIDVAKVYSFQFGKGSLPNFNTQELVQSHGYSKRIDYLFHVKELRPSIACKLFLIEQFRASDSVGEENLKLAWKKICKLAIRNFQCSETAASCVAFLEMIGVNTESLRVVVKSANILSSFGYAAEFLVELFMNLEDDPYAILNLLESKIIDSIDFEDISNPVSFIDSIKLYDIVIKFAVCYNLKLPELFLKQCVSHNMWLPFLILAQIRNYPIEQIKATLQSLKNPNLLEHIHHSVVNDIQVDERSILMRDRDSRSSFLSRVGVHKSVDSLAQSESVHSSITSQTSFGSNSSSMGSDSLEIDVLNTKATLAQILISCHNSTDPPRALLQACQLYRNPLLAILATSYEPDSIVTHWLTWLAVSSELYHPFTNFESMATSASLVAELLDKSMKNRYPKIILQSFSIFLPANPLHHFTDFLYACVNFDFNTTHLTSKLEIFREFLNRYRRYSMISKNDLEMTYLNNRAWIENTSLLLLSSAIEFNCTSLHEQIQFVRCLSKIPIQQYITCPNIQSLLDILTCLCQSNCGVRIDIKSYLDPHTSQTALFGCINRLLSQNLFDTATDIAKIGSFALDTILVKQWQHKYQNTEHTDENFWNKSSEQFIMHTICAENVIEFYLDHAIKVENSFEKYHMLKLAHDWARKFDLATRYDIEKAKWMAYIRLDKSKRSDNSIFEGQPPHLTYKEMLEMIALVPECDEEILADSLSLLEEMVKEALGKGNFWQALKLEKMFKCKSQDLNMLKLSHSLAEGILLPFQLNTEQRLLLCTSGRYRRLSHRRTFLSNRLSSLSSASLTPENLSYLPTTDVVDGTPLQDTLTLLYILVEKVTSGVDIAYKIFMMYRISLNIEIPYHVIVSNTDYMKMLKDALEDDCMHKLDVVHDFIRVYQWSKDEITDFVCEEIVNTASKYVKSKSDEFLMWNLKMDQEFHLVLQLLQDHCSLLGNKIYSYASATHKVQVSANLDFKISELALVTELLITAHDCFTADCNMEGISLILKTCQAVVSHLLMLRSWKLIVRLLTGVGRYTEMSYVFDILRANDQFEFLLRKGSRKDSALKVALLEYLRKSCPDDRDLYKIVALHFALFSEVAMLWEREAQGVIRNLIAISKLEMQNNRLDPDMQPFVLFTNTDGTKLCLNKAIENYTHATEFHLQGEKLAKAMKTAKQGELIALQISLLKGLAASGTAVCLLDVTQGQIMALISKELSFEQSLILVQAYNYSPDWATVLYEQCIHSNNASYLQSFLKHISLTDSLVHDVSRKFLAANINTPNEINAMKDILRNLSSVHTKYRIASEMGFTDLVEDLITGGQLAYLKDTVWKKGYKG